MVFQPQPCFLRYVSYVLVFYLGGSFLFGPLTCWEMPAEKCFGPAALRGWQWLVVWGRCWVSKIKMRSQRGFLFVCFTAEFSSSVVVVVVFRARVTQIASSFVPWEDQRKTCLSPFQIGVVLAVCSLTSALCSGLCWGPSIVTHTCWGCMEGLLWLHKPAKSPECYMGTWKVWW